MLHWCCDQCYKTETRRTDIPIGNSTRKPFGRPPTLPEIHILLPSQILSSATTHYSRIDNYPVPAHIGDVSSHLDRIK